MLGKIQDVLSRMFAPAIAKRYDVNAIYQKLDGEWVKTQERRIAVNFPKDPDVPDPETFLGDGYGDALTWDHKDDLFVDFQILKHIVVDDVAFFMRYLNHELKEEEKQVYPYFYSPCFAEVKEVVAAEMRTPLLEISEEQSCYIAMFQNAMGLLLFSKSDVEDIKRRTIGFEDAPEKEFYQLTFMRFDQSVIDRLDFAGTVITHYEYSKKHSDPLRINFATYNENE